jgi:hypothetical protein
MIATESCWERGCACHDSRESTGVELVKKRQWVGLEAEDLAQIESDEFWQTGNHMAIAMAVEDKLKELNA